MNKRVEAVLQMRKQAFLDVDTSGAGDLGKAITYIVLGASAAFGAGAGYLYDRATEPTDTDLDNARKAYSNANLKASIVRSQNRLDQDRFSAGDNKQSIRVMR